MAGAKLTKHKRPVKIKTSKPAPILPGKYTDTLVRSVVATREAWIARLARKLRPFFKAAGADIPDRIRFACGWPLGKRKIGVKDIAGEAFPPALSNDRTVEIFISPQLDDPRQVAEVLVHELVHACGHWSHGSDFEKLAKAVGLEGPMRSTKAGPLLLEELDKVLPGLGSYPHARITFPGDSCGGGTGEEEAERGAESGKKQTTRMIKCECPTCGYLVRTTRQWIKRGVPLCPSGDKMLPDLPEEEPGDQETDED